MVKRHIKTTFSIEADSMERYNQILKRLAIKNRSAHLAKLIEEFCEENEEEEIIDYSFLG